jgi:hypothetical protein
MQLPKQLSLAVFRVHLENGLLVSIGIGLTGLVAGLAFGFEAAVTAASGALCVSICDQPDPLGQKPWFIGFGLAAACFFTALSSAAGFHHAAFMAAAAFTGLWTGLISVYGKRAVSIATTGILAFVFAMARTFPMAAPRWTISCSSPAAPFSMPPMPSSPPCCSTTGRGACCWRRRCTASPPICAPRRRFTIPTARATAPSAP